MLKAFMTGSVSPRLMCAILSSVNTAAAWFAAGGG
jgi:hypothetical protein